MFLDVRDLEFEEWAKVHKVVRDGGGRFELKQGTQPSRGLVLIPPSDGTTSSTQGMSIAGVGYGGRDASTQTKSKYGVNHEYARLNWRTQNG